MAYRQRKSEKDKVTRKPPNPGIFTSDENMCTGAIQYQDDFGMVKRKPVLFMNGSYFNNLRKYATDEAKELAELKRNERLKDFKNSKMISKDWWDAPENFKRAKEEKKMKQRKKYEEESERIFQEMEIANRETERKILEEAKVMKFHTRQDIRELQGACLLAEVLNEEAAQINFNEKRKRLKREREKKSYGSEVESNSAFFQKETEKAAEKMKADLKYGKELIEQINSRNKLIIEEEKERKERERKFFAEMSQVKNDDRKQRNIEEYLQNLKNDELTKKLVKEERQRDEEMEDKHIKDYLESVFKLNEAMKNKKEEKILASKAKSEEAAAKLNFFKADLFKREAKEKETIERDVERLAERQEQRALDDEKKRKKLAADFLAANIEQRNEDEAKKEALSLVKNYERLRAMKLDDDCKQAKGVKYLQEKEKQALTRAILKEQMDLRTIKEDKEREEMGKYREGIKTLQKKEDEEFLKYAETLIEKSKSNGRDVRPMEKLLKSWHWT